MGSGNPAVPSICPETVVFPLITKPYLEKKIIKGNTYYQLVRKTRIDGKVKSVWSKYLGTPETI